MSCTRSTQEEIELSPRSRAVSALALTLALLINVTPAGAVPQSKLDQARAVKAEVERLDRRAEIAADRYGEAEANYRTLESQRKKAAAQLKKVTKRMGVVQGHLNDRANSMYRQGPMGFVDVLLGAQSFEEFATTWDILHDLNRSDAESVAELKDLRAKARKAKNEVTAKTKAAKKQRDTMAANKADADAALSERQSKLRGLEREIAALEAAEEAARARSYTGGNASREGNWRPASSGIGGSIVDIAKTRLGAPYRWAASGPYAFDCSGFTMWVYAQKGISLPHSSRSQIHSGQRVSRANLEPGDLVFFGSPIHHVGIYVGGGMYIHAPHTGDVVKISSMSRGDYAGACRP